VRETLAGRLGWSFLDADREIEREAGRHRRDLRGGRRAGVPLPEERTSGASNEPNAVLALGGGSILSPVTRERLREGSFTVLLDVSPQMAWRRIEAHAGDRPLAGEAQGFAELYEGRRPLYHAACDAFVDAEDLQGEEALLAPLARTAALAELPRLVGARRAALIADRAVLRVLGSPIDPLVTVRLPVGEAAKTVAVARQAWTRLADFGVERGDVVVAPAAAPRPTWRGSWRRPTCGASPGSRCRRRSPAWWTPGSVGRRPSICPRRKTRSARSISRNGSCATRRPSRRCRCESGRPGLPRW
jgi:shikimate kinase